MSRIHLRIDRLVLIGLQGGQERALVESLRTELSRVLADHETRGKWARQRRTPLMRLGRMEIGSGAVGAKKFGVQVARGIGRGMKA